jgi:AcrR family transcriptional regulator
MRAMTLPDAGPKRKLLNAAESLFAEKGFEVVSVRHITKLANANIAALNYHFGSRGELLTAVMLRYLVPITDERLARLTALEKQPLSGARRVEEILGALVLPLSQKVTKSELEDRLFYPLLGRIFSEQGRDVLPPVAAQFHEVAERFTSALARALPTLQPVELGCRFHILTGGLIHLLTHPEVLIGVAATRFGPVTMVEKFEHFIRHSAAGLRQGVPLESLENRVPLDAADEPQAMFVF